MKTRYIVSGITALVTVLGLVNPSVIDAKIVSAKSKQPNLNSITNSIPLPFWNPQGTEWTTSTSGSTGQNTKPQSHKAAIAVLHPMVSSTTATSTGEQTKRPQAPFHVQFASESGKGPLVTYTEGRDKISFAIPNSKHVSVSMSSSGAIYSGILPNVDLTYEVGSAGLKEGIVLHNSDVPEKFQFLVDTSNIVVRDVPSQGIIMYDTKSHKPVAMIPNPVVTDAQGVKSTTAATMKAFPTKHGQFKIVISIDSSWLHQPKRAFPVTIDPSVVTVSGNTWIPTPSSSNDNPQGTRADYSQLSLPKPGSTPQELMGLRTANSQTFLNPDGSLTTDVYTRPEFYRGVAGHWHQIEDSVVQSSDPNFAFQNGANSFGVFVASKAKASKMLRFTADGDYIDIGLKNALDVTPTVSGDELRFGSALPDTNFQYEMLPNGIKESIVLDSASASNSMSFDLNLHGLSFTQNADGSITFKDVHTDHPVAYIPYGGPVCQDKNS